MYAILTCKSADFFPLFMLMNTTQFNKIRTSTHLFFSCIAQCKHGCDSKFTIVIFIGNSHTSNVLLTRKDFLQLFVNIN